MNDISKRPQGANEGEGGGIADEQYRKRATEFTRRTEPLQKGVEAEREVENYRDDYDRTEESARSRSAGDLEGTNDQRP
jgi:hypothetical protein